MINPPFLRVAENLLIVIVLCWVTTVAQAREADIPVRFNEELIRQFLVSQVYTDADGVARAWDDGSGCNYLTLSDPQVDVRAGVVQVISAGEARVGTVLGARCLTILDWTGFVEVFEEPVLDAAAGTVEFRVVESNIYAADGSSASVAGTLWDQVKSHVHPRMERLQLDLTPALAELESLLPVVFPHDEALVRELLDSIALSHVEAGNGALTLGVRIEAPDGLAVTPAPDRAEPALFGEELRRWRQASHHWDSFVTTLIKRASANASLELRAELLAVLLQARQDVLDILAASPSDGVDPVRRLFVSTWSRLAPALRAQSSGLPPDSALRWLSFIAAGDALQILDRLAPNLGFTLSADALRRMARIAAPDLPIEALDYSIQVDPELRRALGFGAPLPPPRRRPIGLDLSGLSLIPSAYAADSRYDALVERLTGWLPGLDDLDEYLPIVKELLALVARDVLSEGEIASGYRPLFEPLVLATAWQESCWRQFVERGDKYVPISSGTGSIGVMQINQHVWRGFYDLNGLQWDIGYNARAGADILRHYLIDYAIAKKEDIVSGDIQNLARAAYAMYNGGPGQMSRYRDSATEESLMAIDAAFWEKYQTIKAGNALAVAGCYSDN
ncbi:MAG: lytic transglycosylase domain-containing protein [Gammaproteobacteria bacterium]|nr:lytic transglycosylase domain-containing protein [Gammaproteobacteria bacterium]